MAERTVIFIDSNNLRSTLLNQFGKYKLDFEMFTDKLNAGRQLVRAYYYIMMMLLKRH